jgi:hypothetical protein
MQLNHGYWLRLNRQVGHIFHHHQLLRVNLRIPWWGHIRIEDSLQRSRTYSIKNRMRQLRLFWPHEMWFEWAQLGLSTTQRAAPHRAKVTLYLSSIDMCIFCRSGSPSWRSAQRIAMNSDNIWQASLVFFCFFLESQQQLSPAIRHAPWYATCWR